MNYYWIFMGPLAVALSALALRQNPDPRKYRFITIFVAADFLAGTVISFSGMLHGDWRAVLLETTNFVAFSSAFDSIYWLREHPSILPGRYYIWWSIFWAALLAVALSQNLAFSWLALELSTLASAALIVEMRDSHSLEAAWKYVVIASVGLVLALVGIVLIYASLRFQLKSWAVLDFQTLLSLHKVIDPRVAELASVFIVAGFGTKAGLVPFHTWLPDTHSEAPAPVSGLLSGVLLGLSLFVVGNFLNSLPALPGTFFGGLHLLVFFGTISIVVGSLALLVQSDLKRLLAYSSIEQVGIMAVGLGIHSALALEAVLLQFVFHAVIKSSLFYGAGHLTFSYGTKEIDKITGLGQKSRSGAFFWSVGILALAGLPPLGLAYSEWLIIYVLWLAHDYLVLLLVSCALTLTFAALCYHLMNNIWGSFRSAPRPFNFELGQSSREAM